MDATQDVRDVLGGDLAQVLALKARVGAEAALPEA